MDLLASPDALEKVFTFSVSWRDRAMDALFLVKDDEIRWTLPYGEDEVINCFHCRVLLISLPILSTTEPFATILDLYSHLSARRLYPKIFSKQSSQIDEVPQQIEPRELQLLHHLDVTLF